jgi:hypothetical protein
MRADSKSRRTNDHRRRCRWCPRLTANGGGVCGACLLNSMNPVAVQWRAAEAKRLEELEKKAANEPLVQLGTLGE